MHTWLMTPENTQIWQFLRIYAFEIGCAVVFVWKEITFNFSSPRGNECEKAEVVVQFFFSELSANFPISSENK